MTEFQKKTFEKVKKEIIKFIPDDTTDMEITMADVYNLIGGQVCKLTEAELDALLCIGRLEDKQGVITQRFFELIVRKQLKEG